jgi:hypothetical protein
MKKAIAACVLCLLIPAALSWALPAPSWDEADYDRNSYDVTITRDMSQPSKYVYDITVVFNGTMYFGPDDPDGDPIQQMKHFVLYAPTAGGVGLLDAWPTAAPPNFWVAKNPGNNSLAEWGAKTDDDRLRIGESIVVRAEFTAPLQYIDEPITAIQVQYAEDSDWVKNTPELPPSLLSILGLGTAAFMGRIRRRRKK